MKILRFTLLLGGIALLFFFLGRFRVFDPLQSWATFVVRPIQQPLSSAARNISRFLSRADAGELTEKNKKLEQRVAELTIENAKLRSAINQDESLALQLAFLEESSQRGVPSRVIGRGTEETTAVVILNRGAKDGAAIGYPVMTNSGIFIGKIVEVSDASAKVLLVTDTQSSIPAVIQNETKSPGVVQGRRGLSMSMEYIPQDENIQQGQTIRTSEIDPNVPAGLVIGEVGEVTKRPGDLFQQATVAQLVSFDRMEYVTVLLPD